MKNLRFIIWMIALFSVFLPSMLMSNPVSVKKAELLSKNFYLQKNDKNINYLDNSYLTLYETVKYEKDTLFYIFNIKNKNGFIIISAEDDTYPILAYSFSGDYNSYNISPGMEEFINNYKEQIIEVKQKTLKSDSYIKSAWLALEQTSTNLKDGTEVEPLLTTRWSQTRYYNTDCPVDAGGPDDHVMVGCVATAMSQIMNYHSHPNQGIGTHSYYNYPYGTITADFGNSTYDWESMPDYATTYNSALALINFHCGVSVNMDYGPNGSGSYTYKVEYALETYFDYSQSAQKVTKSYYSTEDWENLMKTELDDSRPIQYRGTGSYGGHSFVLDGYQGEDNNHFHVNWGWGGGGNGYYYLSNLNPGGYNFNSGQYAIIGIEPNTAINHDPIVINPLPDLDLTEGFSTYNIDISNVFEDEDEDELTYSVSCSDVSILNATLSETTLILSEVGIGSVTIILTANDSNGGVTNDAFIVNVTTGDNNIPTIINPLSDLELDEDFGSYDIDISNVFNDVDGDVLSYSVLSSNTSIMEVSLSETTLTLDETGLGTVSITLTANDNNGGIVSDIFLVTIIHVNHNPIVINPLSDLELNEDFGTHNIDISNVFDDIDVNDVLTYSVSGSDNLIITTTLSGTILTLTEVGIGTSVITLTVNDGNGSEVSDEFNVIVNHINHNPVVINPLSDLELNEDFGTHNIDISNVFDDIDVNDVLTYSVSSNNTSIMEVSLLGTTLTLTEVGLGTVSITLTANDNNGGEVSDEFNVIVNHVNHEPIVINPLSDLELNEDFGLYNIDISNVFDDEDVDDVLTYSVSSSNTSITEVSLSGTILTLTEVGLGTVSITLTVNDNNGGEVSDEFNIVVNHVNHEPIVINPLSDLELNEDFDTYNIDISNVFDDIDVNDILTYSVSSSNTSIINPSLSGTILTLTEVGLGDVIITIVADDGNDGEVSDEFNVIVNHVNHNPIVINPLSDLELNEDFGTHNIDISNVFDDIDVNDVLSHSVSSSDNLIITTTLSGTILTLTEVGLGEVVIILTTNDNNGGEVSDEFNVVVNHINHNPVVINPLSDLELNEDFGTYNIDISNVFDDIDVNDILTYSVSSSNTSIIGVSLSGTILTLTEVGLGDVIITLTVNDNNGGIITDEFNVVVNHINHNPVVINPLSDLELNEDFGTHNIDISNVFDDIDVNDVLTYSVSSSNTSIIGVSLSGTILTLTETGLGDVIITLTANDNNGGVVSDEFNVIVNHVNHNPVVINPLSDLELNEDFGTHNIDISNVFDDIDVNDILTYSVSSSNTSIIGVSLSETILTLTEVGLGDVIITLTVNDNNGGIITDEFNVVVNHINHSPVVINPLSDLELNEDFGTYNIDISNVFDDIDVNDVLTYSVSSSDNLIIVTTLSGTILTLSEVGLGDVIITIVANDGNDGEVSDEFNVIVNHVNHNPIVINPLSDLELNEDFGTYNIDISNVFDDEDVDDVLTYSVSSSNTSIIGVSLSGTILSLTEVGIGTSIITLTANDGNVGEVSDYFNVVINHVNHNPIVINPLSDLELDEDFGTYNIDISNVFNDIDVNDVLTYSVSSSNTSIIDVSLSVTILTLTEVGLGTVSITLTVNDNNGGEVSDEFNVIVNHVNHNPIVINTLSDLELNEDFGTYNIDISNVFDDIDVNDVLTYSVSSSNTSIIEVSLSGTILTLTEVGIGTSIIILTANDNNGGVVSDEFNVIVNHVNHNPIVINPLSDLELNEDFGTYNIDISNVFDDEDVDDVLTYSVSSSDNLIITTTLSGTILTLTEVGLGEVVIILTTNDNNGGEVSDEFNVVVNHINHSPVVINPLSDLELNEDFGTYNIDISNVFGDIDVNDILTYSVSSSNISIIEVSLSGTILTLSEVGLGDVIITLTANDGNGGEVSDEFNVVVNHVNHNPVVINPLSDLELNEDFGTYNIDISNVFGDIDVNDILTYSASSSNTSIIGVSLSGIILTLTETGLGTVVITLTANDNNGGEVSDEFNVVVNHVNHNPIVINPLSDLELNEDFGTYNIDISNVFDDEDGDELTYSVSSSNTSIIEGSLSGTILTLTETGLGDVIITLTANDNNGGVVSDEFNVIVNHVNHNPVVINPLSDLELNEDFGTHNIDISNVFDDEDGDELTYSVSSSNTSIISVSLSGTILTLTEVSLGDVIITLTANDNNGGVVSDEFNVIVNHVNHIPVVINPLSDLELDEGFGTYDIDVSNVFNDVDIDDVLTYSVSSSNTSIVEVSLSSTILTLTEVDLGTVSITFTINDNNGGVVSDEFLVTVNIIPNNPPVVVQTLPNLDLDVGFGTYPIDISNVFEDADGDELIYSASSSNTSIINTTIVGTVLTLNEIGVGTVYITLTADDGNDGSVSTEFIVLVADGVNNPPIVVNTIPNLELYEYFYFYYIDISNVFGDVDGDELTYTVSSSNVDVIIANVDGDVLTLTETGFGFAEIILTANDDNGGTVTTSFWVDVHSAGNHRPIVTHHPYLQLTEGFGTYDIDLTTIFFDPDGDDLMYMAFSTNYNVIGLTLSGDILTLNEVNNGVVFIILLVFDGHGFSGFNYDFFWVSVSPENKYNESYVINPNPLDDLVLDEGFNYHSINFGNILDNIDTIINDNMYETILEFSVTSSDYSIIDPIMVDSILILNEIGIGTATITINVKSYDGYVVYDEFDVTVDNRSVKIYPNPSNGLVNISMINLNDEINIYIYDISGKIIQEKHINDINQISFDLSDVERGIYFVKIQSGEINISEKILIK